MPNNSRRKFMQQLSVLAAAQTTFANSSHAQTRLASTAQTPRCIDVHHHILPTAYLAAVGKNVVAAPAPNREIPNWDASMSIEAMNRSGISSAVVSVSTPGVLLQDASATKRLARSCNEYSAQLVADHPKRFGMFASLPLPDVTSSLLEIQYALDVLHAEGIVLMTNYRDRYLGDPAFVPVFDELNRRKAVVFVHPTTCSCNANILPDNPGAMIEFPHDTTRAITSLLFSGTFTRCPDIQFIFSHGGGTLPFLANRIAALAAFDKHLSAQVPDVMAVFKRLHYDTAASVNPITFSALLKLVSPQNVLLGTDFPFIPSPGVQRTVSGLGQVGLDEAAVHAIEWKNAAALFPRLGSIT